MILELHDAGVLKDDQVEQLQTALRTSRMVGQAIGIVMTRRFLTQDEAFTLLQRASNNINRELREIAQQIVLTETLPPWCDPAWLLRSAAPVHTLRRPRAPSAILRASGVAGS